MSINISPVYISNWKRVKLVLGCLVMEERHTGEKMADFVEHLGEIWHIRSKVHRRTGVNFRYTMIKNSLQMHGLVTDTASNMEAMARCLYSMTWAGCLNHILQLVINVSDSLGKVAQPPLVMLKMAIFFCRITSWKEPTYQLL